MLRTVIAILLFFILFCNNSFANKNEEDYKNFDKYISLAQKHISDSVALSILYAKEAYKIIENEGNIKFSVKALNILSTAYQIVGRYNDAISYSMELLKLGEIVDDQELIAKAYLRIGDCYRALLQLKDALYFHNLAIEKFLKLEDEVHLAVAYNHLGATCFENQMYEDAFGYFEKSYKILIENKDTIGIASSYNSLGIIYSQLGNYIEAKNSFLKSLQIFKKYKANYNIASINNNLGKLYIELGEFNIAEEYIHKSYEYSKKKSLIELKINNIQAYIHLYEKRKDFKNAFDYLHQFLILNDSIRKNEVIRKVEQIRIAYDVEKMEKDLILANKQNLIKEKNIRIIIILSLGGAIIAILLLTVLYIKNRQSKTKFLVIEKEKEISELKILKVQEEKKRVKEKFDSEIDFKSRELISTTMHIVQKNELINDIRTHLDKMKLKTQKNEKIVSEIINEIDQNVHLDKDWQEFVKHFKDVHPNFFKQLIETHPDLTSKEIRYCAYSRLNLSLKEIALILNITTRGVEKARSRLRSKLNLNKEVDLNIYLQSFGKS
ncbi:MAG: tetratricopeptide repeat protein [Bacteroidales bacterium]|nr:tetratricopeptide repeat protein [Bacteroidales bacterium]